VRRVARPAQRLQRRLQRGRAGDVQAQALAPPATRSWHALAG